MGTSRFYLQEEEEEEEKVMQVFYSQPKSNKRCKEINLQAKENYCKSNYRELPTHGKLDTILLYRTRPHDTHTRTKTQ